MSRFVGTGIDVAGPRRLRPNALTLALIVTCAGLSAASDTQTASTPDGVPLTRDDMKQALDASKQSTPRLPLPPLTDGEKELIKQQKAEFEKTGVPPRRFGLGNNGRMRAYYLADYGYSLSEDIGRARTNASRNSDSGLDQNLRTAMFWIVSRGNNCTYCLGHQESSLASRGMSDDELAALDHDWSVFDEAHQAAFAFAKKLSFEPYAMTDADLEPLRKHFNDTQITEIVVAVAGFNATNRWTGPLRIKQDVLFPFVRPTSSKFVSLVSPIAPVSGSSNESGAVPPAPRRRPELESRVEVQAALDAARKRTPRLPLSDDSAAGSAQWERLLGSIPQAGAERLKTFRAVFEKGTLDLRTKAIIAYVGARNDRAWYALGRAIDRLQGLGFSEDDIFALDQPDRLTSEADREVVKFARKITIDPALATDDDFARLRKLLDDQKVAEIVYQTTQAAFFDRLTEAAGLQLEK